MSHNPELSEVDVSICIASYNMADTIEQSLSTITENLPQNFEIVIVDQSTDGSKEIIKNIDSNSELEFKTVFTKHPLGVGHARNIAVCEATGDIVVTHVDADDWYDSRFFPAMVELYLLIREHRGGDYFFSSSNMNISSKDHMKNNYLLSSLPIGANEKEYRWRAYKNDDFVGLNLDAEVSGRIKLSDRKTIWSRIQRTYIRNLGMYKIGYSTRRVIKEDIMMRSWSLYSKLFRLGILPFVWFHSLFIDTIDSSPVPGTTLPEALSESTYELGALRERHDIDKDILICELVDGE